MKNGVILSCPYLIPFLLLLLRRSNTVNFLANQSFENLVQELIKKSQKKHLHNLYKNTGTFSDEGSAQSILMKSLREKIVLHNHSIELLLGNT